MLIYWPMCDNRPSVLHGHLQFLSWPRAFSWILGLLITGVHPAVAQAVSPLTARGYTVLPIPQKVVLGKEDFAISDAWHIVLQRGVKSGDVAVESLKQGLNDRA